MSLHASSMRVFLHTDTVVDSGILLRSELTLGMSRPAAGMAKMSMERSRCSFIAATLSC